MEPVKEDPRGIIADDYFGSNRNRTRFYKTFKAIIADDYFGSNRNPQFNGEFQECIIADDYFGSNRNTHNVTVFCVYNYSR